MNFSFLGPILATYQFCLFFSLFWAFFPKKKCKKIKSHFECRRSAQIKKSEENKSGLKCNFLLKSKCATLYLEILAARRISPSHSHFLPQKDHNTLSRLSLFNESIYQASSAWLSSHLWAKLLASGINLRMVEEGGGGGHFNLQG